MKRIVSPVAFATILIPMILSANSTTVTFDTALTNGTEWSFNDKVSNNNNGYYLLQDAEVATPQFGFNITSVEIRVTTTSSCNRNLIIRPGGNASSYSDCAFNTIPAGTTTNLFATWNTASPVRSFIIKSTVGSKGNLYIKSAVISGAPIIDAPTNLQADDITGTRFCLLWTNSENAASNRITVSRIIQHEAEGTTLAEYDFNEFSNGGGNPVDITSDFTNTIPAFAGSSLIYLPTNSEDIIQISSGKQQGSLIFDFASFRNVLDEVTNVSMLVSAKKHSSDVTGVWNLEAAQFDDDDNTSQTTNVVLGFEFPQSPCAIQIKDPAACKSVTLRPSDTTAGNRRILIDSIAFIRNYVTAHVETNIVRSISIPANSTDAETTIRSLKPNADYLVTVTAFDAEGNESSPSEPLAVTTSNKAIPFSIRIQ